MITHVQLKTSQSFINFTEPAAFTQLPKKFLVAQASKQNLGTFDYRLIKQANTNNCTTLAVFAAVLVKHPHLLKSKIVSNSNKTWTVNLTYLDKSVKITVSPSELKQGHPVINEDALWINILSTAIKKNLGTVVDLQPLGPFISLGADFNSLRMVIKDVADDWRKEFNYTRLMNRFKNGSSVVLGTGNNFKNRSRSEDGKDVMVVYSPHGFEQIVTEKDFNKFFNHAGWAKF